MPVTRRKRATPSEENTNQTTEVTTQAGEQTATTTQESITPTDTNGTAPASDQSLSPQSASTERVSRPKERVHTKRVRREEPSQLLESTQTETPGQNTASVQPVQPVQSVQQFQQTLPQQQQPSHTFQNTLPAEQQASISSASSGSQISLPTSAPERERSERGEYTPTIEPGRRTSRGELFRRPPQIPTQHNGPQGVQPLPPQVASPAPVQPAPNHAHPTPPTPTHEISLPLGNLLHLAYNPGYTGSDEARSTLLHKLASESKAGGRARCWNCGSLAVVYDRWNTRSKTFGEVGVAICEVCGAWSVL